MDPSLALDPVEARIVGVAIEKELTTPDQYPLSLNALCAGCNQRSNRDPVLELGEADVRVAANKLVVRGWLGMVQTAGSRVERYRHNAASLLGVERAQIAVLAELLLRGAQQPGELRARAERMAELPALDALRGVLDALALKGLARRNPPAPGARAETWAHTLGAAGTAGAVAVAASRASSAPAPIATPAQTNVAQPASIAPAPAMQTQSDDPGPFAQRVETLEHELRMLKRQLANLAWKLNQKLDPP